MFGKMGDMMGKLQEMKQRAEEIKNKLDALVLTSESAGGDIKIEINGNRRIQSITLASPLQHGDKHALEQQLIKALNQAIEKANAYNETEMKKAASGLLPGL